MVAVVTVRMAASASTAPTTRPTTWKRRWNWARPSTHWLPPCTSSTSGSADSRPHQRAGALRRGAIGRVGRHLDGGGQRVARKLVGDVGLAAERALAAKRSASALDDVAHAAGCRPAPRSRCRRSSSLAAERLVLQVDDDAHPVAPLVDGAAEVERQQPEAAERGERQRDEQDGADADPAGAPEVAQRLAQDEAEHSLVTAQPSHLGCGDPERRLILRPYERRLEPQVRRLSWRHEARLVRREEHGGAAAPDVLDQRRGSRRPSRRPGCRWARRPGGAPATSRWPAPARPAGPRPGRAGAG